MLALLVAAGAAGVGVEFGIRHGTDIRKATSAPAEPERRTASTASDHAWMKAHPVGPAPEAAKPSPSSVKAIQPPAGMAQATPSPILGSAAGVTPFQVTPSSSSPVPPRAAISKTPPATAPQTSAAPVAAASGPHFDVVRVERSGDAVLAGQAAPHSEVSAVLDGRVVAKTQSDDTGHFVMLPPAIPPGDHALSLDQKTPGGTDASQQSIAVSVPKHAGDQVVVALAEPGKPTAILQDRATSTDAAPTQPAASGSGDGGMSGAGRAQADGKAQMPFTIGSVELENGNGLLATGRAPAGKDVRLYLNDAHLADVVAGRSGDWSLVVKKGLTGGHYTVRADQIGSAGKTRGQVVARREVPFDVPKDFGLALASPRPVSPAGRETTTPPSASTPVTAPPVEGTANGRAPREAAPDGQAPRDTISSASSFVTPPPATSHSGGTSSGTHVAGTLSTHSSPAPDRATAVIDQIETALVARGDNLWRISRVRLGQGHRYSQIFLANATQIRDPSLIYPGQVLVVPK